MKVTAVLLKSVFLAMLVAAIYTKAADNPSVTVKGYVLDSACAFTKGLSKPISKQCAISCANAGSPLVILADGRLPVQHRRADKTPNSFHSPEIK
jgi:type 1 fimbria pilin